MSKAGIMNAKRNIRGVLSVLDEYRTRYELNCDEFVIYAAIGEANVASGRDELIILKPTNIANISYGLGIPKETVRRKVLELIKRGLVKRNSNGIYVSDLTVWCNLGSAITDGAGDPTGETPPRRDSAGA